MLKIAAFHVYETHSADSEEDFVCPRHSTIQV